jgi:hypothetical protein
MEEVVFGFVTFQIKFGFAPKRQGSLAPVIRQGQSRTIAVVETKQSLDG